MTGAKRHNAGVRRTGRLEAGTLLALNPLSFLAISASLCSGRRPESVVGHLQAQDGMSASPLKADIRASGQPVR
jgi:hypothetical protein